MHDEEKLLYCYFLNIMEPGTGKLVPLTFDNSVSLCPIGLLILFGA